MGYRVWLLCLAATLAEDAPCPSGYHQKEPVVLGCDGGSFTKTVLLTPVGTPHSSFVFHTPPGVVGLAAAFHVSSKHGAGVTLMHASCGSQLILGAGGVMDNTVREAHAHGGDWSWGGNPSDPQSGDWAHWFDVAGQLDCIIKVELSNMYLSTVIAELAVRWEEVKPCPHLLPGCEDCPADSCPVHKQAVCDGSPFIECVDGDLDASVPTSVPAENVTVVSGSVKLSMQESVDLTSISEAPAAIKEGIAVALGQLRREWITITHLTKLESLHRDSSIFRLDYIALVPEGERWEVDAMKGDLAELAVDLRRELNVAFGIHHVVVSVHAVQVLSFDVLSRPRHGPTVAPDEPGGHFAAFTPFLHDGAVFPSSRPTAKPSGSETLAPEPSAAATTTASAAANTVPFVAERQPPPHFMPVAAEDPARSTSPYQAFAVPAFFAALAALSCMWLVGRDRPPPPERDERLFARDVDAEPLVQSNAGYVHALDSDRDASREENYLAAEQGSDGL